MRWIVQRLPRRAGHDPSLPVPRKRKIIRAFTASVLGGTCTGSPFFGRGTVATRASRSMFSNTRSRYMERLRRPVDRASVCSGSCSNHAVFERIASRSFLSSSGRRYRTREWSSVSRSTPEDAFHPCSLFARCSAASTSALVIDSAGRVPNHFRTISSRPRSCAELIQRHQRRLLHATYVLHRPGCAQQNDQLLREGREWHVLIGHLRYNSICVGLLTSHCTCGPL